MNPLARWAEMIDGTYGLEEVQQMHAVMDEVVHQKDKADGQ